MERDTIMVKKTSHNSRTTTSTGRPLCMNTSCQLSFMWRRCWNKTLRQTSMCVCWTSLIFTKRGTSYGSSPRRSLSSITRNSSWRKTDTTTFLELHSSNQTIEQLPMPCSYCMITNFKATSCRLGWWGSNMRLLACKWWPPAPAPPPWSPSSTVEACNTTSRYLAMWDTSKKDKISAIMPQYSTLKKERNLLEPSEQSLSRTPSPLKKVNLKSSQIYNHRNSPPRQLTMMANFKWRAPSEWNNSNSYLLYISASIYLFFKI